MNILEAISDANLFKPFLGDLSTWKNWLTALSVLYGLPVEDPTLVEKCTGRTSLPAVGFDIALFLTGRRSGKSRVAATVGAFEAILAGHESKLSPGETGYVAICSPTRYQSRIVKSYLRAIFEPPLLSDQIVQEDQHGFSLKNGNRIEILSGDHRAIRGYTLLAAVVDEAAFLGVNEESKVKSDTELIRALLPGLATVGGRLVAISTPYARKGWCYTTWKKYFGNDSGKTLVWNCPSRVMNPKLAQRVVDDALSEDLQAGKSEYLGEFRDDIAEFLPRSIIENLVIPDRRELSPRPGLRYAAFVDVSGGRHDDAALAIAHRLDRRVILDLIRRYKPPFSPHDVCKEISEEVRRYEISRVVGDNYAAEFVNRAFESCGLRYARSEKPKSTLYIELLPRLCSGEIELLDDELLVNQLAGLERRTRSGGKDVIDHASGSHDDVANAVAGVCDTVYRAKRKLRAI